MIPCEDFESRYPAENSPELTHHLENCSFCSGFTLETYNLRRLLAQAPSYSAPVGFEFRLEKRIKGLETTQSAREWKIAPKLLAFATGAALVIIAGTVYHQAYNGGQQPGLSLPASGQSSVLADAESDSTAADSLKALESRTGPWNLETVSAGR